MNALVFLYHKMLKQDLGEMDFRLAARQCYLPCVLSRPEVASILRNLNERNCARNSVDEAKVVSYFAGVICSY